MLIVPYPKKLHVKPRLVTILTLTIYAKQRPNYALTDIFLEVHNIQIMPYKQFFPVRQLKKYTLLPPVVPPTVYFTLLPLLCGCSKFWLLKTFILLYNLCTSQWHMCLPHLCLVVEAVFVPTPPVVPR